MRLPFPWSAWATAWLSILLATLIAAVVLAQLSSEASEEALEQALGEHLLSEAGLLASMLAPEPLESVAALGGARSFDTLRARLRSLVQAGSLHDAALFPAGNDASLTPDATRPWLASRAEFVLIEAARAGSPQLGPLYRATDGALYRSAYTPIPGHPGWVVGVEGSGATLGAVDRLEKLQVLAGGAVVALAAVLGAALASTLTRPLLRLDRELAGATPGSSPLEIAVQGPREVRRLALSARALLATIRERDAALAVAHAAQISQLTALAATVAHEVRNPLQALGLTLEGLGRAEDAGRRATLGERGTQCVAEIERIVQRFLDLSRPIEPRRALTDLADVVRAIGREFGGRVRVVAQGACPLLETDGELLGQVLRNLLRNAEEAGAGNATVRLFDTGFDVSDDGVGVPGDQAAHVFDWFHTTRANGTGLGLPISQRICRALGGDLRLLPGGPTTFRVLLRSEPS